VGDNTESETKGGHIRMDGSEAAAIFGKIVDDVIADPTTTKIGEELNLQYGLLSEGDLKKIFTI
jgi:hypothetical protein